MRTVSSSYLKMIYENCLRLGSDEASLLEILDRDKLDLENPSKRFNSRLAPLLLNKTVQITKRPTIGLEVGMLFRPATLLDIGYAFPFCSNVKEVMALNQQYQPLIQQIGTTELQTESGSAWVRWFPHYTDVEFYRHFVELLFTGYASIGRWLLWGEENVILSVRFRHKPTENLDLYKQIFCDSIVFGAERDEIEFMSNTIEIPMPNRNPEMLKFLKVRLDKQLKQIHLPISVTDEVLFYVQKTLLEEKPHIGKTARILGMSERNLRRKLASEGTSFRTILEKARKANCETYMLSNKYSQSDIALMLGYGDYSAFSRAFKGWFGVTPSQYKQKSQNISLSARP